METSAKKMPNVLVIAGSDSGGGAGIQGDIKTIMALGGFATTAITALTAQNTLGVFGVFPVTPEFVRQQIDVVLADLPPQVIKTGMLLNDQIVATVIEVMEGPAAAIPLVLDPVMRAKGGASLLDENTSMLVKHRLVSKAMLVTPNIPEAEYLTGMAIHNFADQVKAAEQLVKLGAKAALVKGGHRDSLVVQDVLVDAGGTFIYESDRLDTRHTHGTGCTLASAIAAYLAKGEDLRTAIHKARAYLYQAIIHAPQMGDGHGPLGHSWQWL